MIESDLSYNISKLATLNLSYISPHIENFTFNEHFVYSIDHINNCRGIKGKSTICFYLSFVYFKPVINSPLMTVEIKLSNDSLVFYDLKRNPPPVSIKLLDYYLTLDQKDEEMISAMLDFGVFCKTMTIGMSLTFTLGPLKSTQLTVVALNLMLAEISTLMKFMDISYPDVLLRYFLYGEYSTNSIISYSPWDVAYEDIEPFPLVYKFYRYSPYFLDNAGGFIIRNIILFAFGYLFLKIRAFLENLREKINYNLQKNF